ncbi:MAG TPA: hypothetical protein DCY35_08050 [Prolixibacteraceae bacterium]|nr:hypothetical protein [Prolixibacteraceae bacterium]
MISEYALEPAIVNAALCHMATTTMIIITLSIPKVRHTNAVSASLYRSHPLNCRGSANLAIRPINTYPTRATVYFRSKYILRPIHENRWPSISKTSIL